MTSFFPHLQSETTTPKDNNWKKIERRKHSTLENCPFLLRGPQTPSSARFSLSAAWVEGGAEPTSCFPCFRPSQAGPGTQAQTPCPARAWNVPDTVPVLAPGPQQPGWYGDKPFPLPGSAPLASLSDVLFSSFRSLLRCQLLRPPQNDNSGHFLLLHST